MTVEDNLNVDIEQNSQQHHTNQTNDIPLTNKVSVFNEKEQEWLVEAEEGFRKKNYDCMCFFCGRDI